MWTKVYKNVNSFSNRTTSSPQQFGTCVEQNTKYRKCRNPHVHATNCTLSKNCATSCAKKFNSVWTRPVSTLSKWDLVTVRCIICMQHVERDAYMILPLSLSLSTWVSSLFLLFIPLLSKRFAHEAAFESHYSTKSRARLGLTRRLIVRAPLCWQLAGSHLFCELLERESDDR